VHRCLPVAVSPGLWELDEFDLYPAVSTSFLPLRHGVEQPAIQPDSCLPHRFGHGALGTLSSGRSASLCSRPKRTREHGCRACDGPHSARRPGEGRLRKRLRQFPRRSRIRRWFWRSPSHPDKGPCPGTGSAIHAAVGDIRWQVTRCLDHVEDDIDLGRPEGRRLASQPAPVDLTQHGKSTGYRSGRIFFVIPENPRSVGGAIPSGSPYQEIWAR